MSYNQIYPPLSVTMPNHYQAIEGFEKPNGGSKPRSSLDDNTEERKEEDYNSRLEKQRKQQEEYQSRVAKQQEEYQSRVAKQQEEAKERIRVREEIERNKTFCERYAVEIQCTFCVVTLIILAFVAIYVFSILLGTLVIVSNYLFETSMVALFGRAIYNKNFPICSNDIYQGSDCYTRTSTYCT